MGRQIQGFAGGSRKGRGRPVIYDGLEMAKKLMVWSDKEESINICGFCADNGYTWSLVQGKRKSCPAFKHAFEIVKMRLAERRERLANSDLIHANSFARYQSMYDQFLDKYEDKKKDQAAARKKEIAEVGLTAADVIQRAQEGDYTQK